MRRFDQKSGTLQCAISVPNPERLLRPGLFVRVSVPILDTKEAICIPQQAVAGAAGHDRLYVVGADGKAEVRQIIATRRLGNEWVVAKGLSAGERVVVEAPARSARRAGEGSARRPRVMTSG